jgi:hypothetical protein
MVVGRDVLIGDEGSAEVRGKFSKKIANESVVCRQTALVRASLGGRQNSQTA